jgi:hypothetical protein
MKVSAIIGDHGTDHAYRRRHDLPTLLPHQPVNQAGVPSTSSRITMSAASPWRLPILIMRV